MYFVVSGNGTPLVPFPLDTRCLTPRFQITGRSMVLLAPYQWSSLARLRGYLLHFMTPDRSSVLAILLTRFACVPQPTDQAPDHGSCLVLLTPFDQMRDHFAFSLLEQFVPTHFLLTPRLHEGGFCANLPFHGFLSDYQLTFRLLSATAFAHPQRRSFETGGESFLPDFVPPSPREKNFYKELSGYRVSESHFFNSLASPPPSVFFPRSAEAHFGVCFVPDCRMPPPPSVFLCRTPISLPSCNVRFMGPPLKLLILSPLRIYSFFSLCDHPPHDGAFFFEQVG